MHRIRRRRALAGLAALVARSAAHAETAQAAIEECWLVHEGLRQKVWLVRPSGDGPFPVLVWNHGSQITVGPHGEYVDNSASPQIQGDGAGWRAWAGRENLILVVPEGRGYGGSEGEPPISQMGSPAAVMAFLAARARDAVAATDWARGRPGVASSRVAVAGASHGGVVSLLASAVLAYAGTAIQATGPWYRRGDVGLPEMRDAAARATGPLLVQHLLTDTLVPVTVSRAIAEAARAAGRDCEELEYPGVPGLEGHRLSAPGNREQWLGDFNAFLRRCLPNGR